MRIRKRIEAVPLVAWFRFTAALCLVTVFAGNVHAETVYKYAGADGTPTYSDRAGPDSATSVEKIEVPAGPSEAEQRAAARTVQQIQETSAELERARLASKAAREQKKAQEEPALTEKEPAAGSSTAYPGRYPTHIPIRSPDGGDHPIYNPDRLPGTIPGIPRPPIARPPIARPSGGGR
jgi:hypothetical protein